MPPPDFALSVDDAPLSPRLVRSRDVDEPDLPPSRQETLELLRLAEDAVRLRDEFLLAASHDLRTPLSALILHVHDLLRRSQRGSVDPEKLRSRLQSMDRQLIQMTLLLDRLLDGTRLSSGDFELALKDGDLAAIVDGVVARLRDQLVWARCPLTVDVRGPIAGRWDKTRLDQVIANLITNAMKYGQGKPIEVTAASDGERATITVRDHGIGIGVADQERIFEKFERAEEGREFPGMGLGLWIARHVIEAHGGAIGVSSRPGAGSAFLVSLPIVRSAGPESG